MRRGWIVRPVVLLAVLLVLVVAAYVALRHFTGAGYIGSRLSDRIAEAGGVNRIRVGTSSFNPLRGTYVATGLEFLPDTLAHAQRARAGTGPRTRYAVTASSLRVDGVRFWPLLRGSVIADSIAVDGARVEVYLDRTAGPVPPVKPAVLPHVSFQSIGRMVRIGSIRFTDSECAYAEKAADGSRPGTIRFTELDAIFRNVTNDSARMAPSTPCTIDVRTRVAGAGRLDVAFGYDLLSPRLNMTCRGTVARMQARSLNDLLVNLVGIRITDGVIDSTWFDLEVNEDVARGKVQVLYRDLDLDIMDKDTHDQGVVKLLQTFLANETKLSQSNPPDDETPAKIAAIERERTPEVPLIKFLWESLRAGIFWTVGL